MRFNNIFITLGIFLLVTNLYSQNESTDSLNVPVLISVEEISSTSKIMISKPEIVAPEEKNISSGQEVIKSNKNVNELNTEIINKKIINKTDSIPSGFPIFIDTGNYESDTETYNKAKRIWIENNPDEYRRMTIPTQNANGDNSEIKNN
ncbi:MAG: hypothetical protein ABIJ97_04215 [Bacteroidota bacterium]